MVVRDDVCVDGGSSGEHEVAPIGGNDGVAVAGLGEGEGRDGVWYKEVDDGWESGSTDEDGGSSGVSKQGGGGYYINI